MTTVAGFPDVELAVAEILGDLGENVGTTFDPDLDVRIRVNRTGGAASRTQDHAIVEVTCLKETRPESAALNQQVRSRLIGVRGYDTTAGFIDKISETTAPIPLPYFNEDVRQVSSVWTVTSRLQQIPG
jgi:hypothetical protein